MPNLETRIKNIKFWKKWLAVSWIYVGMIYLPVVIEEIFPGFRSIYLGAIADLPESIMILTVFFIGFGPYLSLFLLALGLSGLSSREIRCPRCKKKQSVKELEAMGNNFLCPYCFNTDLGEVKSHNERF